MRMLADLTEEETDELAEYIKEHIDPVIDLINQSGELAFLHGMMLVWYLLKVLGSNITEHGRLAMRALPAVFGPLVQSNRYLEPYVIWSWLKLRECGFPKTAEEYSTIQTEIQNFNKLLGWSSNDSN